MEALHGNLATLEEASIELDANLRSLRHEHEQVGAWVCIRLVPLGPYNTHPRANMLLLSMSDATVKVLATRPCLGRRHRETAPSIISQCTQMSDLNEQQAAALAKLHTKLSATTKELAAAKDELQALRPAHDELAAALAQAKAALEATKTALHESEQGRVRAEVNGTAGAARLVGRRLWWRWGPLAAQPSWFNPSPCTRRLLALPRAAFLRLRSCSSRLPQRMRSWQMHPSAQPRSAAPWQLSNRR